jgi:small GTP-binding protein
MGHGRSKAARLLLMNTILSQQLERKLSRVSIVGNVDDGKSTLIGRLFLDSHHMTCDQEKKITNEDELAHFTDGLKEEQQKGITIDVAHRYYSAKKNRFLISDCPGHTEFIQNMVTGSSLCDLLLVVIDVSRGWTEQTQRHIVASEFAGVKSVVFILNKMDLVNYNQETFENLRSEIANRIEKLSFLSVSYIPASAKKGDCVTHRSQKMPWYNGLTLSDYLDNYNQKDFTLNLPNFIESKLRIIVERVRDDWLWARQISGVINTGDILQVGSTHKRVQVLEIFRSRDGVNRQEISGLEEITLKVEYLGFSAENLLIENADVENLLSVTRGTWLTKPSTDSINSEIKISQQWPVKFFGFKNLNFYKPVLVKKVGGWLTATVKGKSICGEVTTATLEFQKQIPFDDYTVSRETGSFVIIDETTFEMIGVGIII